ncbi:MAG: response regulator [Bacteroidetes bacterium]|jgi:signal transduction histidine kinase/CheY-like chemotaxis protein/ligand-binding sensor domain-containing protein|nr:response regulator [Bacteroidota bacterium]
MMKLLFLFMLFIQQFSLPVSQEYIVRNYTIEDGLPVNSVNRMVQDVDGYLYFATSDGLARFDGDEFKIFNSANTPGLASNRISDMMYVPLFDELWLLHSTGSLTRKSGSTFETYRAEKEGELFRTVQMVPGAGGEIWIATEGGVATFDRERNSFRLHEHLILQISTRAVNRPDSRTLLALNDEGLVRYSDGRASVLLESTEFPIPSRSADVIHQIDGDIWIAGAGGAFRYSENLDRIDAEFLLDDESINVWSLHIYGENSILLNSNIGFYLYRSESGSFEPYAEPFTASTVRTDLVFKGKNGENIHVGGENVVIDGRIVLSTKDIISAFLDRAGSLWISTLYNGVYQVHKSSISNITPEEIPNFENIYPVIQASDGSIWAGSFHNGVYRLTDSGYQNWSPSNSNIPDFNARFLAQDSDGTIYAGFGGNGLWTYSNGSWQKREPPSQLLRSDITIQAMHRSGDLLLFGTTGRMIASQNGTFSVYREFRHGNPDSLRMVRVIRESPNGTLFTGSFGYGLSVISGDTLRTYTAENSDLSSNYIRDIFVESEQTIWVATEDLGLNRVELDSDNKPVDFRQITTRDGLIHNSLHRIIKTEDDRLWISSNGGIMSILLENLNRYLEDDLPYLSVLGLYEKDGMVNREANGGVQTAGVLTDDQMIYFPNQRGLTVIDLQSYLSSQPSDPLNLLVEEVSFSDSTIIMDDENSVSLPSGSRNLRIKFTAPQFTSPEKIRFRYKLEGVHSEWETANETREAVFTNIPPGRHTFLLSAYEIGSEEIVSEASAEIMIPSYFYEAAWFQALLMMGLLGLVYGGVRYRTKYLKQREKELQIRVNEQTEELRKAAKQKSRFFSGITHELKTPLSLIAGPLDDLLHNDVQMSDPKVAGRLHLMKRNSERLQNLVNQILDVTRLNSDALRLTHKPIDIVKYSRHIAGQFQSALDQKEIRLIIDEEPIHDKIYVDPEAWERILINLLSNAIRFSPRDSEIRLIIKDRDEEVLISVKDEGFGMKKEDSERVFDYLYQAEGAHAAEGTGIGLYLVKGLTEHMGGKVGLQTRRGVGSEFLVSLKKGFDHFTSSDTVLHDTPDEEVQLRPSTVSDLHVPNPNGHPENTQTILLVEDNDDFRTYLQSVLSESYRVVIAKEGEEAFETLEKTDPDLILSDIMMPGMNGFEFVENLRKKEKYRHLPVIFLSARDLDTDKEKGLSTGADVYLTKPVKSNLLLTQIEALLRRERLIQGNLLPLQSGDEAELVMSVREIVYRHLANPSLSVEMLAEVLFVSRSKLYADWKEVCDTSLNAFIKEIRLNEAKKLITEHGFSVQETAAAVGFPDPNYFSTSFKKEFGVSPSQIES